MVRLKKPAILAWVAVSLLLPVSACLGPWDDTRGDLARPPSIAYAAPVHDSVTSRTTYTPLSTGGSITNYATRPILPSDVSFNHLTGRIVDSSGGQPGFHTYKVIAEGPGGNDTAEIAIADDDTPPMGALSITIGLPGEDKRMHDGKYDYGVWLGRLIVTLTSSVGSDSIVRDTLMSSDALDAEFTYRDTGYQQITRRYALPAFRNWTVSVKVLGSWDEAVVYTGDTSVNNLLAREARNVAMNLPLLYEDYVLLLSFPDSIDWGNGSQKERLRINRVVTTSGFDTISDSTSPGSRFAPEPDRFIARLDSMRPGYTLFLGFLVYADGLTGWDKSRVASDGDGMNLSILDTIQQGVFYWSGLCSWKYPNLPSYRCPIPGGVHGAFGPRRLLLPDAGGPASAQARNRVVLPKIGVAADRKRFGLKPR